MLLLTLVRHGSTALNEERRYQGWSDPPLSTRGRSEAARLRERLGGVPLDRLVSSSSLRAAETAALACPEIAAELDPRLRELHFGRWEGLTYAQCQEADADRHSAWISDPTRRSPPGGESFASFRARVDAAFDALPPRGALAIVTHAGPIRQILCRALGVHWRHAIRLRLSPGGITRLALHGAGGELLTLNDSAHLEEP